MWNKFIKVKRNLIKRIRYFFEINNSKNEIDYIDNEEARDAMIIIYSIKENKYKWREEEALEKSVIKDLLDTCLPFSRLKL